jgi:hypothetical protein
MRRRLFLPLIAAVILAFGLQDFIWKSIIVPLIYYAWVIMALLRSVPQDVYWYILVAILALIALISLLNRFRLRNIEEQRYAPAKGPIQTLATNMRGVQGGPYFKWVVAHQLGRLARGILVQREGEEAIPKRKLQGRDWEPPVKIQAYLESGLDRSFFEIPRRGIKDIFSRPSPTPLDADMNQVIDYIESQMEIKSEHGD